MPSISHRRHQRCLALCSVLCSACIVVSTGSCTHLFLLATAVMAPPPPPAASDERPSASKPASTSSSPDAAAKTDTAPSRAHSVDPFIATQQSHFHTADEHSQHSTNSQWRAADVRCAHTVPPLPAVLCVCSCSAAGRRAAVGPLRRSEGRPPHCSRAERRQSDQESAAPDQQQTQQRQRRSSIQHSALAVNSGRGRSRRVVSSVRVRVVSRARPAPGRTVRSHPVAPLLRHSSAQPRPHSRCTVEQGRHGSAGVEGS